MSKADNSGRINVGVPRHIYDDLIDRHHTQLGLKTTKITTILMLLRLGDAAIRRGISIPIPEDEAA